MIHRLGVARGWWILLLGLLVASVGVGGAGEGLPIAAQGTKGAALVPLRVITFSPPLPLVVGQRRGFFAAEGLDVEHVVTASSAQLMRGTIDGTYDIACTNPDNWITYVTRDDADVFMFAGIGTGGERVVMARPEIQTAADLRGRALAVDAPDSGLVMILWQILNEQGVDFRTGDPRLVPLGATGQRLDSMVRGETYAAVTSSREAERALELGFHPLGRSSESLPDYPGSQCGTTRRWAAAHPDLLVRFIRALVATADWALQEPEAAMAVFRDADGVSRAVAEEGLATTQPDAAILTSGIQRILDLRVALGLMDGPAPPAERFYDTRYWEQATGRRHP